MYQPLTLEHSQVTRKSFPLCKEKNSLSVRITHFLNPTMELFFQESSLVYLPLTFTNDFVTFPLHQLWSPNLSAADNNKIDSVDMSSYVLAICTVGILA